MTGFKAFFGELKLLREMLQIYGIRNVVVGNSHVYTITDIKSFTNWDTANWGLELCPSTACAVLWSFLCSAMAFGAELSIQKTKDNEGEGYKRLSGNSRGFVVFPEGNQCLKGIIIAVVYHGNGVMISVKAQSSAD